MSTLVLWIDREQAKIMQFTADAVNKKRLHERHVDHHTHRLDNLDNERYAHAFFKQVAERISPEDKILVIGPGAQKSQFVQYLKEENHALAKNIVGCETVDHPTDPQIVALAVRFFEQEEGEDVVAARRIRA